MDHVFVRTASIVVCAVWAAGCGGPAATVASLQPQTEKAAPGEKPATLNGEIASAHALRVKGEYAEAAKSFGQLMLVAPDEPQIVAEYGKTLLQQGRADDAMPFLRRALELQADDWSVYSAIGVAYDQLDDRAHARQAYMRALSLKPGAPQILNNMAVSRMLAGDLEGARRLFVEASTSGDPKIAANLAILASMKKPVAAAVTPPAPPHPAPLHTAAAKPVDSHGDTHGDSHSAVARQADSTPRVIAGAMMQRVPSDPQAGPVGHGKPGPADAHKTSVAAATDTKEPMLRTAADGE